MAAREISIFAGDFQQSGIDTYTELLLSIATGARRAIQIYKININIDAGNLVTGNPTSIVSLGIFSSNDPSVDESPIVTFEVAHGANNSGWFKPVFDWTAPPGLILAKKSLVLGLYSGSTGRANLVRYQIYYKTVSISDIQYVQLQRL